MNNIKLLEDEIVSIEYLGEDDTIDITVEGTHMFFANDIYTHNSGFDAEFVEAHQSGGSIKRIQKSHFFMSVAKTPDQKEAGLANIRIIKARFAKDGQTFKDCYFNNDTLQIRIEDDRFKYSKLTTKKVSSEDIDKLESDVNKMHVAVSQYSESAIIEKANSDDINTTIRDVVYSNLLESYNKQNDVIKPNIDFESEITSEITNQHIEEIKIEESIPEKVINVEDLENSLENPDEANIEHKTLHQILEEQRKKQNVIKND